MISDLVGKLPKEPPKSIKNQPQELPKLPEKENNKKIPPNIENNRRNSKHKLLITENKLLREKIKQLEQAKKKQEQIIVSLKNDKENLTKQLIQVQNEKNNLLKLLSSDLQIQQANLSNKEQNNHELHQQLIAQIQVITKN